MTPTPEELAYERGKNAGKMETRVDVLEVNGREQTKTLIEIGKLVTSLTTTVQLLDKDIKSRAEKDKEMWELRDQSVKETANAVKEVVATTALAATNERETKAQALLGKNLETNTKFIPRVAWANYALVIVGMLAALGTFYATFHK
jgi:uncharacterized coiled-coil protein SlyX